MKPRDMALIRSSDQGASWQPVGMVGDFWWRFEGCPHIGGGLAQAGDEQLNAVVWTGAEPDLACIICVPIITAGMDCAAALGQSCFAR